MGDTVEVSMTVSEEFVRLGDLVSLALDTGYSNHVGRKAFEELVYAAVYTRLGRAPWRRGEFFEVRGRVYNDLRAYGIQEAWRATIFPLKLLTPQGVSTFIQEKKLSHVKEELHPYQQLQLAYFKQIGFMAELLPAATSSEWEVVSLREMKVLAVEMGLPASVGAKAFDQLMLAAVYSFLDGRPARDYDDYRDAHDRVLAHFDRRGIDPYYAGPHSSRVMPLDMLTSEGVLSLLKEHGDAKYAVVLREYLERQGVIPVE